jgi:hypothetical protein
VKTIAIAAAIAAVVALAPAASALTPPSISFPAPAPVAPPCTAGQLRVTFGGERADSGQDVDRISVTDTGPACVLPAYAGLGLENGQHQRLPSEVAHEGSPSTLLLLLYGLSAHFTVTFGGDSTVGAVSATYLRVWTGGRYRTVRVGPVDVYEGELTESAYVQ